MSNDILLSTLKHRPEPYEPNAFKFWDDDHISKSMLEAHLDPDTDAATRKPAFVCRSVRWIAEFVQGEDCPKLLDLGCGPGIYAALFRDARIGVTGVDFSRRSVEYARAQSAQTGSEIEYILGDYLGIDYAGAFDIVTLISCDFGVLSPENRAILLKKIYRALKPGGRFIMDVHSLRHLENRPESASWGHEDSGFWSDKPHACFYAFLRYDDTNSYADRYIIADKDNVRSYNIWNHRFSKEELLADLIHAGFAGAEFYSSVAGDAYSDECDTICAVALKEVL